MKTLKGTATTALLLMGFLGALGVVGPALDIEDHGYEHEVAREELAKEQRTARFEKAAREICGENASWALTSGKNEIVCKTKAATRPGKWLRCEARIQPVPPVRQAQLAASSTAPDVQDP